MTAGPLNASIVEAFEAMPPQLQAAARYILDKPDDVALLSMAQALEQAWAGDAALARPVPDLAALARSAVDLKAPVTHPPLEGKGAAGAGAATAV